MLKPRQLGIINIFNCIFSTVYEFDRPYIPSVSNALKLGTLRKSVQINHTNLSIIS